MAQKANTATVDVDFLIGSDHKLAGLAEIHIRRYLALWGLGSKLGVEMLPAEYSIEEIHHLEKAICVGRGRYRLIETLQALGSKRLVGFGLESDLNRIRPPNCDKSASSQLQSGRFVSDMTPTCSRLEADMTPIGGRLDADLTRIVIVGLADRYEKGINKRHIERHKFGLLCFALPCSASHCLVKRPAASPPPSAVSEETEKLPLENPSTNFNYKGVLLGKLRAAWKLRFGSTQHPNMEVFLSRCRARDISPIAVLNYAKKHMPDEPMKYVQSLMAQGDGLWPDDGDENYVRWENGIVGAVSRNMATGKRNPSRGI